MPKKDKRVPVDERAVVQRINRKFKSEDGPIGRQLKKTRGRVTIDLGDFYILNIERNFVAAHHVDPEKLARELGVLANWEYMEGGN